MKFIFLLLAVSATLYSQQTGWVWQDPTPQGNDFYSFRFINSLTGFGTTNGATVEKTTDAGLTWQHFATLDRRPLHDCCFLNESTGYAVGEHLKIVKTTDGCLSWLDLTPAGNTQQTLSTVDFIDANTGYVGVGEYVYAPWGFYKTTDGGKNWSYTSTGNNMSIDCFEFANGLTGYMVGGDLSNSYIKITTDGGGSWSTQLTRSGGQGIGKGRIKFLNANTGFTLKGYLWETTNSGQNWIQIPNPSPDADISYFEFRNINTGYILLTTYLYLNKLAKTTDGGISWDTNVVSTSDQLKVISFSDNNNGLLLGQFGAIFRTSNSGTNWQNLFSGFVNNLTSIQFVNLQTGFVSGSNKLFAKTTDGGNYWVETHPQILTGDLGQLYFLNNLTGYIAGTGNSVFKTTDGGVNWNLTMVPGQSNNLQCVKFTDDVNGYITGSGGNIYKTTNSGGSWSLVYHLQGPVLGGISFPNSTTGFVTSGLFGSPILKTTDAGLSWSAYNTNIYSLGNSFFVNVNTGYVAGSNCTILKTTNCGSSWNTLNPGFGLGLSDIFFTDENTGYAVGGIILKTTDAGNNWQQMPTLSYGPHSLYFANNLTGWIINGSFGGILKTTTGGTIIGLEQISSTIPSQFLLSQNYPNPFNPNTTIKFSIAPPLNLPLTGGDVTALAVAVGVKLVMYDVLGRKVATLVNQQMQPGSYSVDWDATNYPSGVYFYRLEAGDYTQTRKMVLIK